MPLVSLDPEAVRETAARYLQPDSVAGVAYLPDQEGADLSAGASGAQLRGDRTDTSATQQAQPVRSLPVICSGRWCREADVRHTRAPGSRSSGAAQNRRSAGYPGPLRAPASSSIPPRRRAWRSPDPQRRAWSRRSGCSRPGLCLRTAGWHLGPTAASDWLGFGATVLTEHLAEAAALLDQVCTVPRFGEADITTERDLMEIEAEQVADDMFRYPFQLGFAGAFGDQTYGLPVSGLPETLAGISAAEVRDWHTRACSGVRPVVLAVGDIDPEEASATLAGIFQEYRPGDKARPVAPVGRTSRGRDRVVNREKAQSALAMIFPGPLRRDHSARGDVWAAVASGLGDACSRLCATGARWRIRFLRRAGSGGEPERWSPISRPRRSGRKRRGRRCCTSWRGFEPRRSRRRS